jgi:hypothetical protein
MGFKRRGYTMKIGTARMERYYLRVCDLLIDHVLIIKKAMYNRAYKIDSSCITSSAYALLVAIQIAEISKMEDGRCGRWAKVQMRTRRQKGLN